MAANEQTDGRNDFDFFIGKWKVHHRRLRARLKGSTDWEEFEGECVDKKILDGMGNFDESYMDRESGRLYGSTIRIFSPKAGQWSLYWADSVSGYLFEPMIGEFKDGVGYFYSQEPFEGKAIFSRFIWSKIAPTFCQWEQAFSPDGGATWETNWIMENTRLE